MVYVPLWKNMSSSIAIPNIWKNKKIQTTNQLNKNINGTKWCFFPITMFDDRRVTKQNGRFQHQTLGMETSWVMDMDDMDLDLNMEIPEFMIHGKSREENQDDPRKNQQKDVENPMVSIGKRSRNSGFPHLSVSLQEGNHQVTGYVIFRQKKTYFEWWVMEDMKKSQVPKSFCWFLAPLSIYWALLQSMVPVFIPLSQSGNRELEGARKRLAATNSQIFLGTFCDHLGPELSWAASCHHDQTSKILLSVPQIKSQGGLLFGEAWNIAGISSCTWLRMIDKYQCVSENVYEFIYSIYHYIYIWYILCYYVALLHFGEDPAKSRYIRLLFLEESWPSSPPSPSGLSRAPVNMYNASTSLHHRRKWLICRYVVCFEVWAQGSTSEHHLWS